MAKNKTVIKFKFLKPGGFSITGFGNFCPALEPVLAENAPGAAGNVWVVGHDYNKDYSLELPSEVVRELPPHIAKSTDDLERLAYRKSATATAAKQHEENNLVRDELKYHEGTGLIQVVHDSFFDAEVRTEEAPTPRPGRPPKNKPADTPDSPDSTTPQ